MRVEIAYRWFLLVVIAVFSVYLVTTMTGEYQPIPYFCSFIIIPAAVSLLVYDWYKTFDHNH